MVKGYCTTKLQDFEHCAYRGFVSDEQSEELEKINRLLDVIDELTITYDDSGFLDDEELRLMRYDCAAPSCTDGIGRGSYQFISGRGDSLQHASAVVVSRTPHRAFVVAARHNVQDCNYLVTPEGPRKLHLACSAMGLALLTMQSPPPLSYLNVIADPKAVHKNVVVGLIAQERAKTKVMYAKPAEITDDAIRLSAWSSEMNRAVAVVFEQGQAKLLGVSDNGLINAQVNRYFRTIQQ